MSQEKSKAPIYDVYVDDMIKIVHRAEKNTDETKAFDYPFVDTIDILCCST